jgi:hypothetical protein
MVIEQLLECLDVFLRLFCRSRRDGVAWHGDGEVVTSGVLRENVDISSDSFIDSWERLTIPGKIFLCLSAAHAALGLPPFKQSSNSKSGWRTGLEKDTRAESFGASHSSSFAAVCQRISRADFVLV